MNLLFLFLTFSSARECKEGWTILRNSCIKIAKFGIPRKAAELACENEEAQLFLPDDQNMLDTLRGALQSKGLRAEF